MALAVAPLVRRVATYERVSSDDQALRQTIKTQTDELARALARDSSVVLVERYVDDGVSGTIPLAERPAGGPLMRDAAGGRFDEIHVYKFDRLGRDAVDLLVVRRRLIELGIRVISVVEAEPDLLSYDLQAVVADHARREFLRRSADGMARAAREGRYTGGIVPYGYTVLGTKQSARLVPDQREAAPGLSGADAVRLMYRLVATDGLSCGRVAEELNHLGVLPHYALDGRVVRRGERTERTQGVWRAGRVRNTLVNPVYRGESQYGRRTARTREVISAGVTPLVEPGLWEAAQATLAKHRIGQPRGSRPYLLRGIIRCGACGLTYVGSAGRAGAAWYRCNGRSGGRGPLAYRCPGRGVRADRMDALVWADVERLLRDPARLAGELGTSDATAIPVLAERLVLQRAEIDALDEQRRRVMALHIRGHLGADELETELRRIAAERAVLDRAQVDATDAISAPLAEAALAAARDALERGLSDAQRHGLVALVVRGVVSVDGSEARLELTYAQPGQPSLRRVVGLPLPRSRALAGGR